MSVTDNNNQNIAQLAKLKTIPKIFVMKCSKNDIAVVTDGMEEDSCLVFFDRYIQKSINSMSIIERDRVMDKNLFKSLFKLKSNN